MFGCSKAAEESQARTARKENSPLSQQQACFGRETKLLRAVIREDMSMAMVDELITDITRSVQYLDSHFTINVNDVHKPEGKSLEVRASAPVRQNPCMYVCMFNVLGTNWGPTDRHASTGLLPCVLEQCMRSYGIA